MKLLVVLVALGYAVQADKPICDENGWRCMVQDLTELNEITQEAVSNIPEDEIKIPDTKISLFQLIVKIKEVFAEVGGDKIEAMWQEVDETIQGSILEVKDMNVDFSINLEAFLKIFSRMTLFNGTISMKVENFNALIEMSYYDGKFITESCETTPAEITIVLENEATMNSFLGKILGNMNSSLFTKGPFGKIFKFLPSGFTETVFEVLQSTEKVYELDIHICDGLDTVFMFLNSIDGIGGYIQNLINQS